MHFLRNRTRPPRYAESWRCYSMPSRHISLLFFLVPLCAAGQTSDEFRQILDRLSHLEEQNRNLTSEVRALREQLTASHAIAETTPPAAEAPAPAAPAPA